MDATNYEKLILEGISDLPKDALCEVADFVYFLRQKAKNPTAFSEEYYKPLIIQDLDELNQTEFKHLEEEFENYEQLYPQTIVKIKTHNL